MLEKNNLSRCVHVLLPAVHLGAPDDNLWERNSTLFLAEKEKQEKKHYFVPHALQAVNREGEGPERTEYVVHGRPRGALSTEL